MKLQFNIHFVLAPPCDAEQEAEAFEFLLQPRERHYVLFYFLYDLFYILISFPFTGLIFLHADFFGLEAFL